MAAARSTARTKKASSAKAPAKISRSAKVAKPAARSRPQAPRTKQAPAKSAPISKRPANETTPKTVVGNAISTIDRLQQVALTATNLDSSIAFYRDVLGLKFITRFDPPGLAFFNLGGGVRLLLSASASHASLYFQVEDVNVAVKELHDRGVHFLQPPHMIQRDDAGNFGKKGIEEWMAFFHDPAGNLLALVERR
jgi:catechol 2,3-dioxygenase-like lactoylglutathione lyase family enzyme